MTRDQQPPVSHARAIRHARIHTRARQAATAYPGHGIAPLSLSPSLPLPLPLSLSPSSIGQTRAAAPEPFDAALVTGHVDWLWHDQTLSLDLIPHAPDSDAYRAYARLLCDVYRHHGVSRAARRTERCLASCSHLVLARDLTGAVIGGLRIHLRKLGRLPVQAALPRSRRLATILAQLPEMCAEPSGTVVQLGAKKSGLGHALVQMTVAALPLLGAAVALGFGHRRVLPLYQTFGFMPDARLGVFQYPDDRYRSQVAVLRDTVGLSDMAAEHRAQVLDMRARLLDSGRGPGAGGSR